MANTQLILAIASSQVGLAGQLLRAQDTNNTGRDDIIGKILQVSASVLSAYGNGDVKGVNKNLKVIADSINSYLDAEA